MCHFFSRKTFLPSSMEKLVRLLHHLMPLLFMVVLLAHNSEQLLPPSQLQALGKIQQLFNNPRILSNWNNEGIDFCNLEPNPTLTLVCYEDNITQIHITGNTSFLLPKGFPTSSFFSILADIPSLKVLSLVYLGLGGPLPGTIESFLSLEILNLSSNHFDGTIPLELSYLRNLQTLTLDYNMFTGQVPDWLCSLPGLAVLSLKSNSLSGTLPYCFSRLQSLRILALSKNHFFGQVPDLQKLTNLQVLDLEENNLGPHFPSLHDKLVTIVLRKNKFRSGIPENLTSYYQLEKLDVSLNDFTGPFHPSLLSLRSLSYLDISRNKLSGRLSQNMSCNSDLAFANLSSNLLSGDLPACLHSDSKRMAVSYSWNCLSQREQKQHPYSFCHNEALAVSMLPREQNEKKTVGKTVVASSMAGGFVGGIALICLVFLTIRREYAKRITKTPQTRQILEKVATANTFKLLTDARYISETMKMGPLSLPAYRSFALGELKEATNNFHVMNLIGEGSHGQVYKGLLTDRTPVAIRSLKLKRRRSMHTSDRHQIEMISKFRHCHLVSVIGYCIKYQPDDSNMSRGFLVFEFVPNGTLREFIAADKFTWKQRMKAAIEIARGIQFLHTGIVPGVFSNHLKITNILLDHDLHVKISGYNLALLAENRRLVGTEASSSELKENADTSLRQGDKDDVYDFGVILLEVVVGRAILNAHDIQVSKDIILVSLTEDEIGRKNVVDPRISKECTDESMKIMMDLCIRCLSDEPSKRPSVEDVIWKLQFAAQLQDSWKMDSDSTPRPIKDHHLSIIQ